MRREIIKPLVALAIIVILFVVVTIVQGPAPVPRQFRGVLQYPMGRIGGEGSSAVLVTADKTFDLFIPRKSQINSDLPMLAGKQVVVVGVPLEAHGMARGAFPAIKVVSIAPDATVLESPVGRIDDRPAR